jgi:dTDP-4-dehydrorhamnose 3,5-epimerase
MSITKTKLDGVWIIDIETKNDERGFFATPWTAREFQSLGLETEFPQYNISFNHRRGTVRGMHYQTAPYEEVKLVSCTRGAMYDVVVDLRPNSPTMRHWIFVELSAENRRILYIPKGCAHGYQTLEDATEVHYQVSEYYHPESSAGIRWDDSAVGIQWPLPVTIISPRDQSFELLTNDGR